MTKPKSDFRKFIDAHQALPDDVALGNIVWHTIMDGAYDLAEITNLFTLLDMNIKFLPEPTTQVNAFQKACTRTQAAAKPYYIGQNVHEVMALRQVVKDDEILRYNLIREIRSPKARRLRLEPVAEIVLYRPTPGANGRIDRAVRPMLRTSMFADVLHSGEDVYIQDALDFHRQEFFRLYDFVDGDKLRFLVRDYLGFLNAIMMKPGVYFVHRNREDELHKLATFVRLMSEKTGTDSLLEMMPIPDFKRLRESVITAYQQEAVKEFEEVVKEIGKIRSTRSTITTSAYTKVREQYNAVSRKAVEYSRTLGVTQDMTAGAAEVALAALAGLQQDLQKQLSGRP